MAAMKRSEKRRAMDEGADSVLPALGESQTGDRSGGGTKVKDSVGVCFVPVTEEMVKAEKELQESVIGKIIPGGKRYVFPDDLLGVLSSDFGILPSQVKVCHFYPFDFLLKFTMPGLADKVAFKCVLSGHGFKVAVRKWSQRDESDMLPLKVKVDIKVEGIPTHAWQESNVRSLLSPYCWIQDINMAKFLQGDMSSVHVIAWVSNTNSLPSMSYLGISEPQDGGNLAVHESVVAADSAKNVRQYPIKFTVTTITYPCWIGTEAGGVYGEESGTDSTPSGAYDYDQSSENGSLESGYNYDSDREPAGWK